MTTHVESVEMAQGADLTGDLEHQAAAPALEPLVGAGLVSVDSGGLITAWTAQAERTFGWRRGEVIGHPLVATVATPQERQRHERDLERVLSGEAPPSERSFQIHARHRGGEELIAQLALVPVPLGRGYEFSAFLDEVGSREWTAEEVGRLHGRHRSVVDAALEAFAGVSHHEEHGEPRRAAGALVLFRSKVGGSEAPAEIEPEPVVELPPEPQPEAELPPEPEPAPVPDLRPASVDLEPIAPPAALSSGDVRQALEHEGFVLSCQPVLDLRTNEVGHFELLLRMTDEHGRLVLPQGFLGVAEEAGLRRDIDAWVVRHAIALLAEQQRMGRYVRLEISLSAHALDDPELPVTIEQDLAATGAEPSRLVLGLSEQVVSVAPDVAAALAARLRGMGCRFVLREFGSTFSAMVHLKQLPLDYVKLDGGLISRLADSRTDQLVLKAVVDIATGIGAETVADLVSDERTLVLLRQAGVTYAQGYHVGPPRRVSDAWSAPAG